MSTKIFSQQKNTMLNSTKTYLLFTSFLAPSTPAFLRGFAHVRVRTALEPAKGGFLFQRGVWRARNAHGGWQYIYIREIISFLSLACMIMLSFSSVFSYISIWMYVWQAHKYTNNHTHTHTGTPAHTCKHTDSYVRECMCKHTHKNNKTYTKNNKIEKKHKQSQTDKNTNTRKHTDIYVYKLK